MTRLICVGDVHLRQGARQPLRLQALEQIVTEGSQVPDLGAWLVPGDIFDAKSTPQDRNEFAGFALRMIAHAPVVITPGNHGDELTGDLDIFGHIQGAWPLYVVPRPQCLHLRLATGAFATVAVMPYPSKGGLVGAGVAHGDLVTTAAELLDPTFMYFARELEQARAAGHLTWYMGHHAITGAVPSSGQPLIGRELEVPQGHLDRLGPILKVVNHIHAPQEVGGAIYPGSIAPMDWGETHACRYLVVAMRDSHAFDVTEAPIDVPRLWHVEGALTRDGFTLADHTEAETRRRYEADAWGDAEVRVRYSYLASERAALDEQRIRITTAQRLKIESVVIPDRELRAPAVAKATTLAEKLAAMREDGTLPPGVAAKLAQLEHLAPEDVLTAVRDAVAGDAATAELTLQGAEAEA